MRSTHLALIEAHGTMRQLRVPAILLVGIAMAACASSLPPAVQVQDLRMIAGKWQGTGKGPAGTSARALTIREDGDYESVVSSPGGGFTKYEGVLRLRAGKIVWLSRTTGGSGIMTLHEGGGQRVLSGQSDNGSVTFTLTPVP